MGVGRGGRLWGKAGLPVDPAPLGPDFQVDFSWIASAVRAGSCAQYSKQ